MNVIKIEDNLEHEVAELICLKCLNRWIGVYPSVVTLKNIECKCGAVGYVIKTGQTLDQETQCDTCRLCINGKCKLGLTNDPNIYCDFWDKRRDI